MNLQESIIGIHNELKKRESAKLLRTIKTIGDIPKDEWHPDQPDLYGFVEVTYNEFEGNYLLNVDTAIRLLLLQKEELSKEEKFVLEYVTENIQRREKAEEDAGDDL